MNWTGALTGRSVYSSKQNKCVLSKSYLGFLVSYIKMPLEFQVHIVSERNGKWKREKSRILGNVGINCAAGGWGANFTPH